MEAFAALYTSPTAYMASDLNFEKTEQESIGEPVTVRLVMETNNRSIQDSSVTFCFSSTAAGREASSFSGQRFRRLPSPKCNQGHQTCYRL